MGEHKCTDCGYLGARNIDTRRLDEVEWRVRYTGIPAAVRSAGALAHNRGADMPMHEPLLVCFKRERDLIEEAQNDRDKVHGVIANSHECSQFTEWKQGFTPKEHQEMADRKAALKYQEDREEAQRQWQEGMEVKNREWQVGQERKTRRYMLWGAFIGAGAAVTASILTAVFTWVLGKV